MWTRYFQCTFYKEKKGLWNTCRGTKISRDPEKLQPSNTVRYYMESKQTNFKSIYLRVGITRLDVCFRNIA